MGLLVFRTQVKPPTLLTPSAISVSAIAVSWVAPIGFVIASYELQNSLNGTTGWTTIYTGATASTTNGGLTGNTRYYYRVRCTDDQGHTSGYGTVANTVTLPGLNEITDGLPVILSGPGIAAPAYEFLGGLNGHIDSATLSNTFSKSGWTPSFPGLAEWQYSNTQVLGRSKSILADTHYVSTNEGRRTYFFDCGAAGITQLYLHCNYYLDIGAVSDMQWKIFRLLWRQLEVDNEDPSFYIANWHPGATNAFINIYNQEPTVTRNFAVTPSIRSAWFKFQVWWTCNTAGLSNGTIRILTTRIDTGATIMDQSYSGLRFRGTTASPHRYPCFQNYLGNENPDGTRMRVWMDDPYFSWVSSGTGAFVRAELWNAPSSPTLRTPCAFTITNGSDWTITPNKGSHSAGPGKYLAMFDGSSSADSSATVRGPFTLNANAASLVDNDLHAFTSWTASTNTAVESFMGGHNGYLDAGTPNTDMNPPLAGWVGPDNPSAGAGPGSYYPRFDATRTRSRANSMGCSGYHKATDPHNWSAFGYGYDYGTNAGYPEVYFNGYVYFGCLAGLTQLQWKVLKEKPTPSIVDGALQVNYSHWLSGGDQFTVTQAQGHFGTGVYFQGGVGFPDDMPAFNSGQWYRFEYWHRVATDTSASNGAITIKMWRESDGAQVMNDSFTGIDDFDTAERYRYFILQNYFGNAAPNTQQEPGDGFAYWDDVLVRFGAQSRQGIWLGDASTISACNLAKLTYQPHTVWNSIDRTIRINKGPFTDLSTGLYLYETDANGAFVSSTGIALQGGTVSSPGNVFLLNTGDLFLLNTGDLFLLE